MLATGSECGGGGPGSRYGWRGEGELLTGEGCITVFSTVDHIELLVK